MAAKYAPYSTQIITIHNNITTSCKQ